MTTSLAVLERVLPPAAVDEVEGLLDLPAAEKLALYAADLERLQFSPLLGKVPEDSAEAHRVADISKDCGTAVADLEATRKARVAPLNDEVKRVNALYGLVVGQFQALREQADKLWLAFTTADRARVAREREEAMRRANEAAEREAEATRKALEAEDDGARAEALALAEAASREIAEAEVSATSVAAKSYRSAHGTLTVRETYVLDDFAPDKIPAEYWRRPKVLEAVRKELAAAVRAGAHEIPGCAISLKESTARRS